MMNPLFDIVKAYAFVQEQKQRSLGSIYEIEDNFAMVVH